MLHYLKQKNTVCEELGVSDKQVCFKVLNTNFPLFYTPEIQNCPRFWQLQRAVHRFHIDMEAFTWFQIQS